MTVKNAGSVTVEILNMVMDKIKGGGSAFDAAADIATLLRRRDREIHNKALTNAHSHLLLRSSELSSEMAVISVGDLSLAELMRDNCEICFGETGNVLGNENIIGGRRVCDDCHVALGDDKQTQEESA